MLAGTCKLRINIFITIIKRYYKKTCIKSSRTYNRLLFYQRYTKVALTLLVFLFIVINYQFNKLSFSTNNLFSTTQSIASLNFTSTASTIITSAVLTKQAIENYTRCMKFKKQVSWGVVDYAKWDGDPQLIELLNPVFTKKRLVIWSLDHHPAPIYDIKSIVEPLGVEFIDHSIYPGCKRMCSCDTFTSLSKIEYPELLWKFNSEVIERLYRDRLSASDVARADAFLVAHSVPLVELFVRYNRSIIVVSSNRYNLNVPDHLRWHKLNGLLQTLYSHRWNIVGSNNHYDVEYMHYFLGVRPDYIPSFTGYTGAHYNPIRQSFLYAHRVFNDIGPYWKKRFERQYRRIHAKFIIEELRVRYKPNYEYSDLAAHLGIVHRPYQTSTMSFFEHYNMAIPLFSPSVEFLAFLQEQFSFLTDQVGELVIIQRMRHGPSRIPSHPSYNGTARVPSFNATEHINLDPNNNLDPRSLRHWLSLSDFYMMPHVVIFHSIENLVDILESMWKEPLRLQIISNGMRIENRLRLKYLLSYWRRRLIEIGEHSPHKPE